MDKSVPAAAAVILDFIRKTEVGSADRSGYDVIYGHKQHKLAKPLTSMTLDEIVTAQKTWSKNHGSSAAGGYQFMRKTLLGLMEELKLIGTQKLTPDLQDRLGYHLLKRRGYEQFISGKISTAEFAKRLAQEWASFPVLEPTQGAHRKVERGQSYYAGDGLNKALVKPEAIEQLLSKVQKLTTAPRPSPPGTEAAQPSDSGANRGIIAAVVAAIVGLVAWLSTKVCDLTGFFCGG